jgi:hypothetical protein
MKVQLSMGITTKKLIITDCLADYIKLCERHLEGFKFVGGPSLSGQSAGSFVYVADKDNIITVVHELIHAVDSFIEYHGFVSDSELRAYLVEGLLRQYVVKVLGWKHSYKYKLVEKESNKCND